jgi:hypothetical protein
MTRNEFKNQVVNHLSRLSHKNDNDATPIRKHFPDEKFFSLYGFCPWYADLPKNCQVSSLRLRKRSSNLMQTIMFRIRLICGSFVLFRL